MKPTVDKQSLNLIAENYHLNPEISDKEFDRRFHQLCFEWVRGEITDGRRVLELGYGEGNVTRQLLEAGKEVEIVEGAKLLVERARAACGQAVTVHHALFSEFHPTTEYDAILATNILEHVADPVATLQCVRTWCGPRTKVVVTVPNAGSIHRRLAVLMGIQPSLDTLSPRDHMVGHMRVYDLDGLVAQVKACGFKIVGQKGFLLKVLPNSMMKGMSPELVNAFYAIAPQMDIRHLADIGVILMKDDA